MLLLAKSDISRMSERLRSGLGDLGIHVKHTIAMNAVSAALGFNDTNAMTAALRTGPIGLLIGNEDAPAPVSLNEGQGPRPGGVRLIRHDPETGAARMAGYLADRRGATIGTAETGQLWSGVLEQSRSNEHRFNMARRMEQRVVVIAICDTGPNSGAHYISMTPRTEVVEAMRSIADMDGTHLQSFLGSLARAIRAAVTRPVGDYRPENDQDLMEDLPLLLAARMVSESPVEAPAGLSYIGLLIDPDDSLPWDQRGMLDPDLLRELGLSDRPSHL